MHAYDASHCAKHQCICGESKEQWKVRLNTWLVKKCFLLLNSSSSVVLLASMVHWVLCFFLRAAFNMHLTPKKYACCEGQPHYLPRPLSPINVPMSSCNARIKWCLSSWAQAWDQIDVPKWYRHLRMYVRTYVHLKNRSFRVSLMHSAIIIHGM